MTPKQDACNMVCLSRELRSTGHPKDHLSCEGGAVNDRFSERPTRMAKGIKGDSYYRAAAE